MTKEDMDEIYNSNFCIFCKNVDCVRGQTRLTYYCKKSKCFVYATSSCNDFLRRGVINDTSNKALNKDCPVSD